MVMRGRRDVVEALKASFGEAVAASEALPADASMADRIAAHFGPVERALHAANVELARLRRAGHDARAAALEAEIRPIAIDVSRFMDELVREAERQPAVGRRSGCTSCTSAAAWFRSLAMNRRRLGVAAVVGAASNG